MVQNKYGPKQILVIDREDINLILYKQERLWEIFLPDENKEENDRDPDEKPEHHLLKPLQKLLSVQLILLIFLKL